MNNSGQTPDMTGPCPLPVFPVLDPSPRRSDPIFVVAYVAYHQVADGGPVVIAQRDLQHDLRRSNGSEVSAGLRKLRDDGFLGCIGPEKEDDAKEWVLHQQIQGDQRDAWVALGTLLFGPEPQCLVGRQMGRPSIKHGYVELSGFLILALLQRCGAQTLGTLVAVLDRLVTAKTVEKKLALLVHRKLVAWEGDLFSSTSDCEERLSAWERDDRKLGKWAKEQDERIADERLRFRTGDSDTPEMKARKRELRAGPCDFCGVMHCGEVEHFPPKHWGGFDHPYLMRGACRSHNSSWGNWIKGQSVPILRRPGTLHVVHASVDIVSMASAVLEMAHECYLYGRHTGDIDDLDRAREAVERAFPFWLAVFTGRYPLRVVNERLLPDDWVEEPFTGRRRVGRLAMERGPLPPLEPVPTFLTGKMRDVRGRRRVVFVQPKKPLA
jgi:hypothetical protein